MTTMRPLLIGLLEGKSITGVQISFKNLTNELNKRNYLFRIVNLDSMQEGHRIGSFSIKRVFEVIRAVFKSWAYIPFSNLVYITVGLSLLGFVRDALILLPSILLRKRTIIHVKSGGYGLFYNQQCAVIQKFISWMINKINIIILLSDRLKDQFEFVTDNNKFIIIPNTVDGQLLETEITEKKLNNSTHLNLLFLSNLMYDKGYLEVLEACRILNENRVVHFYCYFCGEFVQTTSDLDQNNMRVESLKASFLNKIIEFQLGGQVMYLGVIKGDEKVKVLQSSHLFVLPTRYPWEGQPVSILEAMAYGIPVIATSYRSIPDQVQDGVTGYLLNTADPAEIASRVEELWLDPQKYEEMSRQAIRKFWNEFSPEQHIEKMIQILYGE